MPTCGQSCVPKCATFPQFFYKNDNLFRKIVNMPTCGQGSPACGQGVFTKLTFSKIVNMPICRSGNSLQNANNFRKFANMPICGQGDANVRPRICTRKYNFSAKLSICKHPAGVLPTGGQDLFGKMWTFAAKHVNSPTCSQAYGNMWQGSFY